MNAAPSQWDSAAAASGRRGCHRLPCARNGRRRDFAGRGIGSALLEHAARGHATASVDVNEQNSAVLRWYQRRGFAAAGSSETDAQGAPFPILHLRRG